jgi:hypothetical protein
MQLVQAYQRASDFLSKLGGTVAPRTLRISRAVADRIAEVDGAQAHAHYRTQEMIDRILGPQADQAKDKWAGGLLTERRLRYAKESMFQASARASKLAADLRQAAAADAQAGHQEHPQEAWDAMIDSAAKDATRWMIKARGVKSIIGWEGSPFATFDDYQKALASPEGQELIRRWDANMPDIMEENFRRSKGMEDGDPIKSLTQIPGSPVNLKALAPDDPDTPTTVSGPGRGNLRAVRQGSLVFAREFTGGRRPLRPEPGEHRPEQPLQRLPGRRAGGAVPRPGRRGPRRVGQAGRDALLQRPAGPGRPGSTAAVRHPGGDPRPDRAVRGPTRL